MVTLLAISDKNSCLLYTSTVLILDDLIATGGTVKATGKLVRDMGAKPIGYGCILELAFLNPREKLTPSDDDVELFSLVTVD